MRQEINSEADWWAEFNRVRPAMVRNQMRLWDRADSWAVSTVLESFYEHKQLNYAVSAIETMLNRIAQDKKAETFEELIALRVLLRKAYFAKKVEAA